MGDYVFVATIILVLISNHKNCGAMRITNDLFPSEIYITEDEKGPVYNQPREHLDEKAMMSVPVKSQREIEQMIDEANKMSVLQKISEDYRFCIKNVINTTLFKEDFYNLDSGNIVQVSKKYCQNVPAFLKCNDIYRYQIDKYANGDNRADPSIIKLIFEETFITFICSLDSQSLTEFYVVGGLQCLYVLSKPLNQCVNLSFSKYKQTHLSDSDTGREFENQCKAVMDTRPCVLSALTLCNNYYTRSLTDQWYEYFRRETPCTDFLSVRQFV